MLRFGVVLLTLSLLSCTANISNNQLVDSESGWLVSQSKVRDGGPGPDGIPAIDNPVFLSADDAVLDRNELVVGLMFANEARAYPHNILNWHEIVNDVFTVADKTVSLSYCPLTGSSLLWQALPNSVNKSFGTSGLLYNTNLVLYDRETKSLWSQMLQQSINGRQISVKPEKLTAIETTWQTWKTMYPDTQVLSEDTGFSRNYQRFPYGSYRTDNAVYFPVDNQDSRLHRKSRVLGYKTDTVNKVYQVSRFSETIEVINETLDEIPLVVIGSSSQNFAVAFKRQLLDGTDITLTAVEDSLPIVMEDELGNQWDVFGNAVSGPNTGEQLGVTNSFIAYWFAWVAFFPNSDIHFPVQ